MKTLALSILTSLLAFSCNQKEGCRDTEALNYDPSAKTDGICKYTKVIFYAGGNVVGGNADIISKIELYTIIIEEYVLLGTISNLNKTSPAPEGCSPPENAVVYEFKDSFGNTRFIPRYYYENGAEEWGDTYILSPEKLTECIVQNLTL